MKNFRELKVWQKGHKLTLDIYKVTGSFPKEEIYSLTSQIRRASYSIPSNIAEGCGRDSDPELKRYLNISFGSANELDYQLLLSHDLGYLDSTIYQTLHKQIVEIRQMLQAFIKKLKADG